MKAFPTGTDARIAKDLLWLTSDCFDWLVIVLTIMGVTIANINSINTVTKMVIFILKRNRLFTLIPGYMSDLFR